MAIRKAVIDPTLMEYGNLSDIEFQIDGGECLGISTLRSMDVVASAELLNEQLAVGNDGSPFPIDDASPSP
jgi:hypothetical protein